MSGNKTPELKQYMDKRLAIQLNGKRSITGKLRGFDQFMNLVLEDTTEDVLATGQKKKIGTVMVRGNSVIRMECLDRL
eukprot:g3884.t1